MSSVSSIASATNTNQTTSQNNFFQIRKDFNSIGSALQSGNLSDAQSALSAFQQDLQSSSQLSSTQPFGTNTQANTDYQNLTSALQSGNLSDAQKAYSSLQSDLQSSQTHKGHRHHHGSWGGSAASLINNLDTNTSATSANITTASSGVDVDGDNGIGFLNVIA
jgi:outer membrane protein assembly factor BamD (BamD/ComL family)